MDSPKPRGETKGWTMWILSLTNGAVPMTLFNVVGMFPSAARLKEAMLEFQGTVASGRWFAHSRGLAFAVEVLLDSKVILSKYGVLRSIHVPNDCIWWDVAVGLANEHQ